MRTINFFQNFLFCLILGACSQNPGLDVNGNQIPNAVVIQPPGTPIGPEAPRPGVEPDKLTDVVSCDSGIPGVKCVQAKIHVDPKFNPFLSGMPNGWVSQVPGSAVEDIADFQARPVIVRSDVISSGAKLTFNATGHTSNGPFLGGGYGPDGDLGGTFERVVADFISIGIENGMTTLIAPRNSLIGVFLSDDRPDQSGAPVLSDADCPRDFSTLESQNREVYKPKLKQVFFIGDGKTSAGIVQKFIAPEGASRLYFANMDAYEWNNNSGSFDIVIQSIKPNKP